MTYHRSSETYVVAETADDLPGDFVPTWAGADGFWGYFEYPVCQGPDGRWVPLVIEEGPDGLEL